ncbi:sigma-70 family RNA polymerase sigma factor [Aquabacterium sp.]|uniref:sigma-70 family RNA polymerase sigma factor n=1 Tax=Aquabacterium sp. TaxID=1872578 RepID=UPI0025C28266|nr:sigma-70 family RNA polymerase sigma factor [Aquabacterium sp.]
MPPPSTVQTPAAPPGDFDYESAVEACARGERFALKALYERESRWLLAVAMRIVRDRDLAHDVLQEAFLQIWQKAGSYQRALGSGRGWVYTVVRHRALDEVRRQRPEDAMGDDFETLAERVLYNQAAQDAHTETDHDDEALQFCLAQLDDPKRQCVVDAFIEGYTHEQIALRRGKPVGTVKSWIRRGLLALKECLT